MDRINHVKIVTPEPEAVDRFLREVLEVPEGWKIPGAKAAPPHAPAPFAFLDKYELLNFLKIRIMQNESFLFRIPFIEDLTNLSVKKAMCQRRSQPYKSSCQTDRPKLNQAFISENEYDYLDLQTFLDKLKKEGPENLPPEKTVFIFLADEILSMSHITYRTTLKKFENCFSLDDYYVLMRKKGIFTVPYHRDLIAKLFQNDVLY